MIDADLKKKIRQGMIVAVLDRAIVVTTGDELIPETSFTKQNIPDPVWDPSDSKAVEQFIAQGRPDKAIERLINFIFDKDEDLHEALIILQGRWHDNTNALEAGTIHHEDWDVVNNKVRVAVLELMEHVVDAFPAEGEGVAFAPAGHTAGIRSLE